MGAVRKISVGAEIRLTFIEIFFLNVSRGAVYISLNANVLKIQECL